eukprot:6211451-Pleurochrysis_carterae.AAC.1
MFVDHLLWLAALVIGYESPRRAMGNVLGTGAFRHRWRYKLLKNATLRHPDFTLAEDKQMRI